MKGRRGRGVREGRRGGVGGQAWAEGRMKQLIGSKKPRADGTPRQKKQSTSQSKGEEEGGSGGGGRNRQVSAKPIAAAQ